MSTEAVDSRKATASPPAEPPRRKKRPTWVAYLPYLAPGAIAFIVVVGIPFATNIMYSFQKWKGGMAPHHWVGWRRNITLPVKILSPRFDIVEVPRLDSDA